MAVEHKSTILSDSRSGQADAKSSKAIADSDDYGSIGIEELSRRIQADNDERYGAVVRKASWKDIGEAGW